MQLTQTGAAIAFCAVGVLVLIFAHYEMRKRQVGKVPLISSSKTYHWSVVGYYRGFDFCSRIDSAAVNDCNRNKARSALRGILTLIECESWHDPCSASRQAEWIPASWPRRFRR